MCAHAPQVTILKPWLPWSFHARRFKVLRNEHLAYNEQRIPSWCDRVLWKSLPGFASNVQQTSYEACPEFMSSDHKPIRSAFRVSIEAPLTQNELNDTERTRAVK